jgi:hypothetical protein
MLDKYISKQIILAQIASDGGKHINTTLSRISSLIPLGELYSKKGYIAKDACILNAIKAIQKKPNSGFFYHIKIDRTLRGDRHCFIVYFNFKINNERHQVSFHCFSNLWRFINKKCVTRWKKKYSSIESVIYLAYYTFKDNNF